VVLLGVTKIMLDQRWYKPDFCRQFTDFPLLVRTDNLRRLWPEDIQADYRPKDIRGGPSYKIQGLTDPQRAKIGDFVFGMRVRSKSHLSAGTKWAPI